MWLLQNASLLETKLQLQALPHCPTEVNFFENTGANVSSHYPSALLSCWSCWLEWKRPAVEPEGSACRQVLVFKVFSTLRQAGGLRTSQRLAARVSTGSKMPYPSLMREPHKSFAGFLATRTNTFKEKGEFPFNRSSGLFSKRYRMLNGWSFQPRWTELGFLQTSQSTL